MLFHPGMHSQLLQAISVGQMPQLYWLLKRWYLVYALIEKQRGSKRGTTIAKEATSLLDGADFNLFSLQTEAGTWNNVTSPLPSDSQVWGSPNNVCYRTQKTLKNSERHLSYSPVSEVLLPNKKVQHSYKAEKFKPGTFKQMHSQMPKA